MLFFIRSIIARKIGVDTLIKLLNSLKNRSENSPRYSRPFKITVTIAITSTNRNLILSLVLCHVIIPLRKFIAECLTLAKSGEATGLHSPCAVECLTLVFTFLKQMYQDYCHICIKTFVIYSSLLNNWHNLAS